MRPLFLLGVFAVLTATACFTPTQELGAQPSNVGADGGSVQFEGGLEVVVPAGALGSSVALTATRGLPVRSDAIGPVWTLGPEGQRFKKPVVLKLPLDRAPESGSALNIAVSPQSPISWTLMPARIEGSMAIMSTTHFSIFVPVSGEWDGGAGHCERTADFVSHDGGTWACSKLVVWTEGSHFPDAGHTFGATRNCDGYTYTMACVRGGDCVCRQERYQAMPYKTFASPALPDAGAAALIQSLYECSCGLGPASTEGSPPVAWGTPASSWSGQYYSLPFGTLLPSDGTIPTERACEWGSPFEQDPYVGSICSKICPDGDCPTGTHCGFQGGWFSDPYSFTCRP